MVRYYCDRCGKQIARNYVADRLRGTIRNQGKLDDHPLTFAASLNGADRIAAAILALMMRSGMQNVDATTLINAFVKPGSDPTQGGAV